MYIYIYIYLFICVCVRVYIYIYISVCSCVCACVHVHTRRKLLPRAGFTVSPFIRVSLSLYMYICIYNHLSPTYASLLCVPRVFAIFLILPWMGEELCSHPFRGDQLASICTLGSAGLTLLHSCKRLPFHHQRRPLSDLRDKAAVCKVS